MHLYVYCSVYTVQFLLTMVSADVTTYKYNIQLILWCTNISTLIYSLYCHTLDEGHPDPNEEEYSNMIYIGRVDDDGNRVGFEHDNGMY